MARYGYLSKTSVSIQNGDDYISLLDEGDGPSSAARTDNQSRGVKRKASVLDEEEDTRERLRLYDRSAPWMELLQHDGSHTTTERLNAEVQAFNEYIQPRDEEHSVRLMIVECIRQSITRRWPSARVLAFGSQETHLYFPNGDIDLVVHNHEVLTERRDQVVTFLNNISQLLKKARVSRRITVIARARVPIIKFVTELGNFAVDISVNQTNGVRAIAVVNRFLNFMPAVRPLVMVIKAFLLQRGLNEPFSGGFGSYTVICMVVSFLQMHPKIRRREIDPQRNLGVLLLDFLELYGRLFNYSEVGISVREGGSYFLKHRRGWSGSAGRVQMSVEDPVDPENDVARSSSAIAVRDAFAAAYESLSTSLIVYAQELDAHRSGTFTSLGSTNRGKSSLLGSIVGVSQDMLNFRREVQQLFESKLLQNFLGLPPNGLRVPTGKEEVRVVVSGPEDAQEQDRDPPDIEENDILVAVDAGQSPESRYSLGPPAQKGSAGVIYEEDQSVSEGSLSPAMEPPRSVEELSDQPTRDWSDKRAYWTGKATKGAEDTESEAERWEQDL